MGIDPVVAMATEVMGMAAMAVVTVKMEMAAGKMAVTEGFLPKKRKKGMGMGEEDKLVDLHYRHSAAQIYDTIEVISEIINMSLANYGVSI